jgi:hypothetical protein
MLAKAITPLPAAKDEVVDGEVVRHATLADPEVRYRQRYADLAVNPECARSSDAGGALCAPCAISWMSTASWKWKPRSAADLRRRGGAAVRHPPQPAQAGPLPAHLVRAVPQAPAGGRLRAGLRDRARLPQRGRRPHPQPRVHPARVLHGLRRLQPGDGADRGNDRFVPDRVLGRASADLPGQGD